MEELYKLIEDYLNGALPEDQRREVERRMADDEDFCREVELHRAVHEEFRDARGWSLYETMANIMQETELHPDDAPPAEKPGIPRGSRWKWWWVLPVVLIAVAGLWYFTRPDERKPPHQPGQNPPTETKPETPPALPDTQDQSTTPGALAQKKPKPGPIAQAEPSKFTENPVMEALMGVRGNGDITVEMTAPRNADTVQPNIGGQTRLRFSGAFAGLPPREKTAFNLLLFDNQNANKTIKTILLQPTADAAGAATFELRETVGFPKGLYYYRIEELETGEVLAVGKFFIDAL